MNCRSVDKIIFSYCNNELNPQERLALEEHIENCPSCRGKLDLLVLENEIIREAADIPRLSGSFTSELMLLIDNRYSSTPPQGDSSEYALATLEEKQFDWGITQARLAMVAMFVLVFIGVYYLLGSEWVNIADKTNTSPSPNQVVINQPMFSQNNKAESSNSNIMIAENKLLKADSDKKMAEEVVAGTISIEPQPDISSYQVNQGLSNHSANLPPSTREGLADNNNWVVQEANRGKLSGVNGEETNLLLPCSLPDSYRLIGANQGAEEYSFSYEKIDSGLELKITIAPQPEREKDKDSLLSKSHYQETMETGAKSSKMFVQEQAGNSSEDTAIPPLTDSANTGTRQPVDSSISTAVGPLPLSMGMQNSIKETLLINKKEYLVTISGNLPPEELATVASVIDWQEGKLTTDTHPDGKNDRIPSLPKADGN